LSGFFERPPTRREIALRDRREIRRFETECVRIEPVTSDARASLLCLHGVRLSNRESALHNGEKTSARPNRGTVVPRSLARCPFAPCTATRTRTSGNHRLDRGAAAVAARAARARANGCTLGNSGSAARAGGERRCERPGARGDLAHDERS
jgi:hypothetical protein